MPLAWMPRDNDPKDHMLHTDVQMFAEVLGKPQE